MVLTLAKPKDNSLSTLIWTNNTMKFLLKRITGNHTLMLKVFFYLANQVVDATENDLDDRILDVLEKVLGKLDIDNIEDEVDEMINSAPVGD